jgi:peptide/nickel transport system ATP-binding protein
MDSEISWIHVFGDDPMENRETLLEIENLHTNFYTYQGVVKALDGIDFSIMKGETFGLVGETGCGKSVTANCILRLIPSPPGKIERGRIYFMMPEKERERRKELGKKIQKLKENSAEDGKSPEISNLEKELSKNFREWDLLSKSATYMQKIRGKYISMIFQEPMSALNPVFTSGDQIAETLLLHERKDLAKAVIKTIDTRIGQIDTYKRAELKSVDSGGYVCSNCGQTNLLVGIENCPNCGSSFVARPFRGLERPRLRFSRRFYARMEKDPNALSLRISSRIPLLRRYERFVKDEALDRARDLLKTVRIPDPENVVRSFPYELSGGMQQRVMIAMALACKPQLLIADEPTTALDVTIQAQILKIIKELQLETGTSVLLITHNLGVVAETCDRVGVMYAGVMVEIGLVHDIFKEPLHPYTQGLMNSVPRLLAGGSTRLETIPGSVPNLIRPPPGCRFHPRCPYAMTICRETKPPMIEVEPGHFTSCYLYTEAG